MAEGASTEVAGKLHWVRILIGGFLAEALLIGIVIPINMKWGQHPLLWIAPLGSLVLCFLFGLWAARRARSRFALHGFLVGVVAMLIYLALTRLGPEPWQYLLAHGLKLAGGALGGMAAARMRS